MYYCKKNNSIPQILFRNHLDGYAKGKRLFTWQRKFPQIVLCGPFHTVPFMSKSKFSLGHSVWGCLSKQTPSVHLLWVIFTLHLGLQKVEKMHQWFIFVRPVWTWKQVYLIHTSICTFPPQTSHLPPIGLFVLQKSVCCKGTARGQGCCEVP